MAKKQTSNNSPVETANSIMTKNKRTDLGNRLQQYPTVKEQVANFIFDAEDELATAFERFSAKQLMRWSNPKLSGLDRNSLTMDLFMTEGQVAGESIIRTLTIRHWLRLHFFCAL